VGKDAKLLGKTVNNDELSTFCSESGSPVVMHYDENLYIQRLHINWCCSGVFSVIEQK
jgi:hypothetical protein